MDFLDPKKKRSRKIRLMFSYALMTAVIFAGTIVLVYGAYGYSFNTKNGDIVQNGLLFAGSQPGGADIYLNGKPINSTTPARLVLQAGTYDLTLKRAGYRNWDRKFTLEEHTIERYVYPFLFPAKPTPITLKVYSSLPPLVTETPDRHWLLAQVPDAPPGSVAFDEYDTTNLAQSNQVLSLPSDLLTNPTAPGSTLSQVEWSTDNNHLLLLHTYQGGSEYIVFSRSDPSTSFNVNKLLKTNPTQVALFNKKADQLYIFDQASATLRLANVSQGTLGKPILKHVLAFKPSGSSMILYVTNSGAPTGQVQARIWNNNSTFLLSTFSAGSTYMIDTAQYAGSSYFVAGSNTSGQVNFYENPLNNIKDPAIAKAVPLISFYDPGATKASFSTNARFVEVEAGQSFGVYDMETKRDYQYNLGAPLAAPLQWMDGHRLIGTSNNNVFVMDYDATNQQSLVPTSLPTGGYFSSDYNQLMTLAPVAGSNSVIFERVDMRAGVDLPKTQ